jgi:adenosylhomocysteine nucleosidase
MKVCVFEDVDVKFQSIAQHLTNHGVMVADIVRVAVLSEALSKLLTKYDLIVVDLMMPFVSDGPAQFAGGDIANLLETAGGFSAEVVVITEYPQSSVEAVQAFARRGCVTTDFAREEVWKAALVSLLAKIEDKRCYDFIGICSVDVELDGILRAGKFAPKRVTRDKLTYEEVRYEGHFGALVQLPRMGLVNAAAATSMILEKYRPKIMFMSGICGGTGDGKMGRLLISEMCWEYQSGKWTDSGFEHEPYQEKLDGDVRADLKSMIASKKLLRRLESGLGDAVKPSKSYPPMLSIFTSGSAVVAKGALMSMIKKQHRKVSGLDMEIFAFFAAARMASHTPKLFAAKAVVDRADRQKSDKLHRYSSHVSGAFCLNAAKHLLSRLP